MRTMRPSRRLGDPASTLNRNFQVQVPQVIHDSAIDEQFSPTPAGHNSLVDHHEAYVTRGQQPEHTSPEGVAIRVKVSDDCQGKHATEQLIECFEFC
jgi:hypothetical protein